MLIESLLRTLDLRTMPAPEVRLASALRLWVVMNKLGRCPMQAVAGRLGCARASAHLHLMVAEIGAAWPEPFCVSPPCCPRLSHDEALVLEMIRLGREGDRPAFDALLRDMLPGEARDRLFLSASVLSRVLAR